MAAKTADPAEHVVVLESQLSAMTERLDSVYATATDLIADSDLDSVLVRITERAATAVRAPRYLLALRSEDDSKINCHYSGFSEKEAQRARRASARRARPGPPGHLARGGRQLPPARLRPPGCHGRHGLLPPGALPARALRPLCGERAGRRDGAGRGPARPRGGAGAAGARPHAGGGDHRRRGRPAPGRHGARDRRLRSPQRVDLERGRPRARLPARTPATPARRRTR